MQQSHKASFSIKMAEIKGLQRMADGNSVS